MKFTLNLVVSPEALLTFLFLVVVVGSTAKYGAECILTVEANKKNISKSN